IESCNVDSTRIFEANEVIRTKEQSDTPFILDFSAVVLAIDPFLRKLHHLNRLLSRFSTESCFINTTVYYMFLFSIDCSLFVIIDHRTGSFLCTVAAINSLFVSSVVTSMTVTWADVNRAAARMTRPLARLMVTRSQGASSELRLQAFKAQ